MARPGAEKPRSPTLDVSDMLPNRLTAAAEALAREIEAPLRARYELPMKDWIVLRVLAAHGALSPTEIHRVGGQNKAQISRALKCLLDRDLVGKRPHPDDDRTFLVSLTDDGLAMYRDIVREMRRREAALLENIPARDAERLRDSLSSLEVALAARESG